MEFITQCRISNKKVVNEIQGYGKINPEVVGQVDRVRYSWLAMSSEHNECDIAM